MPAVPGRANAKSLEDARLCTREACVDGFVSRGLAAMGASGASGFIAPTRSTLHRPITKLPHPAAPGSRTAQQLHLPRAVSTAPQCQQHSQPIRRASHTNPAPIVRVQVAHRRLQIPMTQKLLHGPHVGAGLQQVRRE
jgi:hypothetical protein